MNFELWHLTFSLGGLLGGEAPKKDLYRVAGTDLFDPIFFHLFALVCPSGRVEEYPSLPSANFQLSPCHSGLFDDFWRSASHCDHPVEERYPFFPKASRHCGEGTFPIYDPDGKVSRCVEGEGSAVLRRVE